MRKETGNAKEKSNRRMVYFNDMQDVQAKQADLEKIVNLWVDFINKRSEQ